MKTKKEILMGNEAIALGLVHAGVDVVSGYPGTPSSEILTAYQKYKKKFKLDAYAEWATNEKVGFEVAYAAAITGKFACATMKQVGLNVASDALMSAAYIGQKGAMLVISADDPGFHSSQTEQDSRSFAKFARVPVLDPSTPQEAYQMTIEGIRLSHQFEIPVILRPVMRVSHAREICEIEDDFTFSPPAGKFERDIPRWAAVPPAYRFPQGIKQLEKIEQLKKYNFESYIQPQLKNLRGRKILCLTSGTAHGYVREFLQEPIAKSVQADILKLDMPYPLPAAELQGLFKNYQLVIVFEETYPCIEEQLRAENLRGKLEKFVHEIDEFSKDKVLQTFIKLNLISKTEENHYRREAFEIPIPPRPPALCPGCPHRDVYYAVMQVFKRSKSIFPSDIGCYTLGINQGAIDSYLCMGASVSMASGFSLADPSRTVVATLGDSTFFHSGVAPLINAVYQRHKFILLILDNSTVAMTGRQTTPERMNPQHIDIKRVVEGCGVTCHEYNYTPNMQKTLEFMQFLKSVHEKSDTPTVAVIREFCVLDKDRAAEFLPSVFATVEEDKCTSCNICLTRYKCPPMSYNENKKVVIDSYLCIGCSACISEGVCPTNAFVQR